MVEWWNEGFFSHAPNLSNRDWLIFYPPGPGNNCLNHLEPGERPRFPISHLSFFSANHN